MDVRSLLSLERMRLPLEGTTKQAVLDELVDAVATSPVVKDADQLRREIFKRESVLSTGIGLGIAIPHAKIASVGEFVLSFGVAPAGVPYDSLDKQPVRIVFLVAGPEGRQDLYLKILAALTTFLRNADNRQRILACQTAEEVLEVLPGS